MSTMLEARYNLLHRSVANAASPSRSSKVWIVVMAAILLAVAAVFHGLILGGVLATTDVDTNDLWYYNYPTWVLYTHALRHGELLQWTPYIQSGFPLFAEGQGGFLYPPTMLLAAILPPITAINAFLILHAIVMGAGTFRFARRIAGSAAAALPSTVAAAICGSLICGHTRHLNAYAVISLTPWLLDAAEQFATDTRIRTCRRFGLVGGLMLLAGHPQFAFIGISLAILYAGIRVAQSWFGGNADLNRRKVAIDIGRAITLFGFAVGCAVVIAWPQMHATIQLLRLSGRHGELPASFVDNGSLPWSGLLTFVFPYYAGDAARATFHGGPEFMFWEGFHYVGISTLVLAVVGLVSAWRRSPHVRAIGAIAVISYLLALGSHLPIYGVLRHLPIVGAFRIPARWLLGTELAIVALAPFGVQYLYAVIDRASSIESAPADVIARRRKLSIAVTGLVLFDITVVAGRQVVTAPASDVTAMLMSGNPRPRADERLCVLGEDRLQRDAYAASHGWSPDQSAYAVAASIRPPNVQAVNGVSSVIGYTSLSLASSASVWGDASRNPGVFRNCAYLDRSGNLRVLPQMPRLMRMWHVGQVRSVWPLPSPFQLTTRNEAVYVYRLPDTMPRAWVVPQIVSAPRGDDALIARTLISPSFEPRRTAVVSGPGPTLPAGSRASSIMTMSCGDDTISLTAPTSGLVVVSDTWYPNWRCTVDGVPARLYRVNACMRGVVAPRAGAVIRMAYVDSGLPVRILCSLACLLFCILPFPTGRRSITTP